jgi:predicted DNA-binding transcriptional regulator AlpA
MTEEISGYVTTERAMEITGLSEGRLRQLAKEGKLARRKLSERVVLWLRADLDKLVEERKQEGK